MNDLNFFSEYIAQRKNSLKKSAFVYALIALIMLSIVSSYAATELTAAAIKAETKAMNDYLSDPKTLKELKEIDELKKKLEILSQYGSQLYSSLNGINKNDVIKSSLLETFNTALPGVVEISSLDYTKNNVVIKGKADGRVTVAELSYNLSALGIFNEVYVSNITGAGETTDNYQFDATCQLKGAMNP